MCSVFCASIAILFAILFWFSSLNDPSFTFSLSPNQNQNQNQWKHQYPKRFFRSQGQRDVDSTCITPTEPPSVSASNKFLSLKKGRRRGAPYNNNIWSFTCVPCWLTSVSSNTIWIGKEPTGTAWVPTTGGPDNTEVGAWINAREENSIISCGYWNLPDYDGSAFILTMNTTFYPLGCVKLVPTTEVDYSANYCYPQNSSDPYAFLDCVFDISACTSW